MYSSICHSDENYLGGSRPWIVDSILGHEGAGIVESVGEDVTEFKAGTIIHFRNGLIVYICNAYGIIELAIRL